MNQPAATSSIARWVDQFRHGQHVNAHLARGTVYSLIAKVLALGVGFLLQLLLARILGAHELGIYYYALSWITILVAVSSLGFDMALVRYVSVYLAQEKYASLRGILIRSNQFGFMAGLICVVVMWWWISINLSSADDRRIALLIAAFLIPLFTLNALRQAVLRGMKKIFQFQSLDMILRPVLIIAALLAWPLYTHLALTAERALMIQIAATILILMIGIYLVRKQLPTGTRMANPIYETRSWLETALPLYSVALMRIVTLQAGLIITGSFLPADQVGVYGVSLRLAELVLFGVSLVDAMAAPMIAELFHAGRMQELQRFVRFATRVTFALAVIASLALYLGGDWILGLYGAEFKIGHRVITIVMFAYILQGLVGPVGYLMSMTGQQKRLVMIQAVAMLVNLGLSFALIPSMGIEGAAIALAVSAIIWQGWMFLFVKRKFGIRSTIF